MEKTFTIKIEFESALTVDEIWPDGDAPENPTLADVAKVLCQHGFDNRATLQRAARNWNLTEDADVTVYDQSGESISV